MTEWSSNSKIDKFDILLNSDQNKRKEILIKKLRNKWNNKIGKFVNIHEVIFEPQTLIFAYADIIKTKKKSGNKLHSINLSKIVKNSKILLNGSWKPERTRQLLILRQKIERLKSLTILSEKDKIIANAMKIVWNLIFEQRKGLDMLPKTRYFHNSNHSFRPNRGCHSALNVTMSWGFSPWFVQAEIIKYYDNISHKKLISILNKSIADQKLMDILYKLYGCMTSKKVYNNNRKNSKLYGSIDLFKI